jgi:hypothetical protein
MLKVGSPVPRGTFRARLEEVEPNMYRAVYAGESNPEDAAAAQVWPDAHVGDSPEAVKAFVEKLARELGYDHVVWEERPS